jgi:hypothetical protein
MIREDNLEDMVREELRLVGKEDAAQVILRLLKQKLVETRRPYIGQHRLCVIRLIKQQIRRSETMSDNLYEDKLSGLISEETYQERQVEIEARAMQLKDRLSKLEALEGMTISSSNNTRSIVGLYDSESKVGKRLILSAMFQVSIVGGRVNIQSIWPKE